MQEVVGDVYINASSETFHHCFQTRKKYLSSWWIHLSPCGANFSRPRPVDFKFFIPIPSFKTRNLTVFEKVKLKIRCKYAHM